MIINDIYNELKRRGHVRTKAEFSTKFLGRATNYLCLCQSGARQTSDDTLAVLARALSVPGLYDLKRKVVAALLREDEPTIGFFPISFDAAVDLVESLNQISTTVEFFEVIQFLNDKDIVLYKIKWGCDVDHIVDNIMTLPRERQGVDCWLAANTRDSKKLEWVMVFFPNANAQSKFENALNKAAAGAAPC